MIMEEKIIRIEKELKAMYVEGELQQLLHSDTLDIELLKFIAVIKDYFIQQQQKEIITKRDFDI